MKRLASSLLVSTGLLVLMLTFSASNTQAVGAPSMSSTAQLSATTAAEDHVVLERRFDSTRGPCTPELGVPTNRVFPDGTREFFVVPAGKAFVLTDLEGEITEKIECRVVCRHDRDSECDSHRSRRESVRARTGSAQRRRGERRHRHHETPFGVGRCR